MTNGRLGLLLFVLSFSYLQSNGHSNVIDTSDETDQTRRIVDVMLHSYLDKQQEPTAPSVFPERFAEEEPAANDWSSGGAASLDLVDLPTPPAYRANPSSLATVSDDGDLAPPPPPRRTVEREEVDADDYSAALFDSARRSGDGPNRRHRMGPFDPGSLTLTLIIVAAVVCAISLITLTAFTVWQYRRRHNSSQWIVGKNKLPAYQADAWCYENVMDGTNTMKKKNRDSVYLASATMRPYTTYDAGSSSISNGTTRTSTLSNDSERRPPPYFDGWNANGQPQTYRENLVN